MLCQPVADSTLRAHGRPPKSCLKSKDVPEASAKILTDAIRKILRERKLQENLKSRGYNIDCARRRRISTNWSKRKSKSRRASHRKTSVGRRNSQGRISRLYNSGLTFSGPLQRRRQPLLPFLVSRFRGGSEKAHLRARRELDTALTDPHVDGESAVFERARLACDGQHLMNQIARKE